MTDARAFRGFRFPTEVILWAVRWYLQFPVSYRDRLCCTDWWGERSNPVPVRAHAMRT